MRYSLLALSALLASVGAAPSSSYRLHEKRTITPHGWSKTAELEDHQVLPMRIALTQSNMDKMEEYLMDVSAHGAKNYGKHWTAKQVAETFAPSRESVDTVTAWLASSGIDPARVSQSQSLGWLHFDATVAEAEALLKTKYHVYNHDSGKPHVACDEYHVPEHVSKHLDFITPTVHFDAKVGLAAPESSQIQERGVYPDLVVPPSAKPGMNMFNAPVDNKEAATVGKADPSNAFMPKQGALVPDATIATITGTKHCDEFITPECLRSLYKIPILTKANKQSSYGIVEYTPQAYLQDDLNMFFSNFSKSQQQLTPILDSIDGGIAQNVNQSFNFNGESDLDLEYGMALANPVPVTLYQVGDTVEGASLQQLPRCH